jgi:hypothetical protein
MDEVMEAANAYVADVHSRPLADGFQALKNLNLCGTILPGGRFFSVAHNSSREDWQSLVDRLAIRRFVS